MLALTEDQYQLVYNSFSFVISAMGEPAPVSRSGWV